jgi:L-aminopeptidase/D-esterase-like protein
MTKYLPIYLNDHYAGSTTGVELAKRAAKHNRGDAEFGPPLTRIAAEIEEDREELKRIMARLEVSEARIKATLGWTVEKAGRLKPNGNLFRFSPLSRLVEVEGLLSGVSGKLSLWRALLAIVATEPRLDEANLTRLAERAEDQLLRLHALRGAAAVIAFGRS